MNKGELMIQKDKETNIEYLKISKNSKKCIFMLHGYGASMNDLFGLESVIKTNIDYDWIFPNGPISIPMGMGIEGRAWFPINMVELEAAMRTGSFRSFEDKEPEEFIKVIPVVKKFIDNLSVEYDEVIIGGFSQGAMVSSHLTGHGIAKQKGLILMSGTLIARDILISKLDGKNPIPFIQSHGKMDPVLDFNESMKLFELLKLCRFQGEFVPFDGAHEIPHIVLSKVKNYLNSLI
jgi:phospholipase/carboxylesterase